MSTVIRALSAFGGIDSVACPWALHQLKPISVVYASSGSILSIFAFGVAMLSKVVVERTVGR